MAAEVEASTQAAAVAASESRLKEQERAAADQLSCDAQAYQSRLEVPWACTSVYSSVAKMPRSTAVPRGKSRIPQELEIPNEPNSEQPLSRR